MTNTVWPLFFNDELLDSEIAKAEAGNGIYISKSGFARFMGDHTDEFVALELGFGDKIAVCHIIGTHNGDDTAIYTPGWMCNSIGCSGGEDVLIRRIYPSIGTKIIINPQNTTYTEADDPVEALRNGFENYSCLISGIEIPLLVNGKIINVAILDTGVTGPICIRGVELSVEIAAEPDSTNIIEQPDCPVYIPQEPIDFSSMLPPTPVIDNRFPGTGRVLGSGNKYRRI
jgi:hypothetical protein